MLQVLSVFEHQCLSAKDFPVVSDFQWLLEQDFIGFSMGRQQGQWQLTVRHYIGVIRLPSGMVLEVLPKIARTTAQTAPLRQQLEATRGWVQRMLTELTQANPSATTEASRSLRARRLQATGQFSDALQPYTTSPPPLSEWLLGQFIELMAQYAPAQQYQQQQQNSAALQGKLLIKEQLQHNAHQPYRFVSEVSQFFADTLSNRLIKQAWQPLSGLILYAATMSNNSSNNKEHATSSKSQDWADNQERVGRVKKTLTDELLTQSGDLSWLLQVRKIQQQWQAVKLLTPQERSQLQSSYQRARQQLTSAPMSQKRRQTGLKLLELAYWLLAANPTAAAGASLASRHSAVATSSASTLSVCLFINMQHAFEQWVSRKLGEYFTTLDQCYKVQYQQQQPWLFDEQQRLCLTMVPDVVVYYQQTARHVIDIKWKSLEHAAAISAADAYQMLAYAQVFAVRQLWLVYPWLPSMDDSIEKNLSDANDSAMTPARRLTPISLQDDTSEGLEIWLVAFNIETGELQSLPPRMPPTNTSR